MKKTIKHLATLMAAALAADCLFVPSAPAGGAPDRTVAASATSAVTAASEAQEATRSAAGGSGPRSRSQSVLGSASRGGRDGTEECNLEPSFAYSVRSSPVGALSIGADKGSNDTIWGNEMRYPKRVTIIELENAPFWCAKDAVAYAKAHGIVGVMSDVDTGGKTKAYSYEISNIEVLKGVAEFATRPSDRTSMDVGMLLNGVCDVNGVPLVNKTI